MEEVLIFLVCVVVVVGLVVGGAVGYVAFNEFTVNYPANIAKYNQMVVVLSNIDDDSTIDVTRLYFDEHGTLVKEQEVTIDPRATWSQKINHYGLVVLKSPGRFTARLSR